MAIEHQGPTCLLLSRQNLPFQTRSQKQVALIKKGGYVLLDDSSGTIELILIATGSEVSLALEAAFALQAKGIKVRLVSMPSTDTFLRQDISYQQSVLPPHNKHRLAIEAAAADYWYKFVGFEGKIIGLNQYGASAPAQAVFEAFGFTVAHIVEVATAMLGKTITMANE
jgi:transketolase